MNFFLKLPLKSKLLLLLFLSFFVKEKFRQLVSLINNDVCKSFFLLLLTFFFVKINLREGLDCNLLALISGEK